MKKFLLVAAWVGLISLQTSLISLPTAYAIGGDSGTNTNECIVLIQALQACQTDLGDACCNPTHAFMNGGCLCNPAIETLATSTPEGEAEWGLFPLLVPICEAHFESTGSPKVFNDVECSTLETYNLGCEEEGLDDMTLQGKRLGHALAFGDVFQTAGAQTACFDYKDTSLKLAAHMTEEPKADVPYGIGVYTGIEDMSEYLGIFWNPVNHGFWTSDAISKDAGTVIFSSDSSDLSMSGVATGSFLYGEVPYEGVELVQRFLFNECETKFHTIRIDANEDMAFLASAYHNTANNVDDFGKADICHSAMDFCTGSNQQYDSFESCMAYLDTVPGYSPACQPLGKVLAGNSVTCRFKHHWMVPLNPDKHCAHIGEEGNPLRGNHGHKCEDAYECPATAVADPTWAPLSVPENGHPLEPEWVAAFDKLNAATAARDAIGASWITGNVCEFNCDISLLFELVFCDQTGQFAQYYDAEICEFTVAELDVNACFCEADNVETAGGPAAVDQLYAEYPEVVRTQCEPEYNCNLAVYGIAGYCLVPEYQDDVACREVMEASNNNGCFCNDDTVGYLGGEAAVVDLLSMGEEEDILRRACAYENPPALD